MSENVNRLYRNAQETVVATLIAAINQAKLDNFLKSVGAEERNLAQALGLIADAKNDALQLILKDRGGAKGLHGFLAEVAEAGINNARSAAHGKGTLYQLLDNNGPVDLVRGGINIQQKFVFNGGAFSLNAVLEHLEKYPTFVKEGGKYQVPADFYEAIKTLREMPVEEANRLSKSGASLFTPREWTRVNDFLDRGGLTLDNIEPSVLTYDDAQVGKIFTTFEREEKNLRAESKNLVNQAGQKAKPTLSDGAKAAAGAAAFEGLSALALSIRRRLSEDKKLKDISADEWKEIVQEAGKAGGRGGLRGGSVHFLNKMVSSQTVKFVTANRSLADSVSFKNLMSHSAVTASAVVSTGFAVADLASRKRKGELNEIEFLEGIQDVCLSTSLNTFFTVVGRAAIPIPVLGALIGSTAGTLLTIIAKNGLNASEQKLIERYVAEQAALDESLAEEYQQLVDDLNRAITVYLELLERAFDPDIEVAFQGAIELAQSVGVEDKKILKNMDDIDRYFLL